MTAVVSVLHENIEIEGVESSDDDSSGIDDDDDDLYANQRLNMSLSPR